MRKVVLDSDGLIKLAKSGVLENILDCFECFISSEVFKEAVIEGQKLGFEDAFFVENLLKKKKLKVKKHSLNKKASGLLENIFGLGTGEISSFHLFYNTKAAALVTDDQRFLRFLEQNKIAFVLPADLIHKILVLRKISKTDAINALEKIKPLIKEEVFKKIKLKIEEELK